jgi:DNA repair exonuclease SbcCD ATPase subunit
MNVDKLAKVLALAASDNDSEAVHALRTARRLLEGEGLDFVELAGRLAAAPDGAEGISVDRLHDTIFDLRNELRHLRTENDRLKRSPAAAPGNFAQAAEDAAAAIRLRAALAEAEAELDAERARARQWEAAAAHHASRLDETQAEAVRLAARIADLERRRQRLEAENRRLGNLSQALKGELDERTAAAPPPKPKPQPRRPASRRPLAAAQYALF